MHFRTSRVFALLLAAASTAQAQGNTTAPDTSAERFVIKHDRALTGSNIPSNLAVTDYPLDKSYRELTQQQTVRIKSQYEAMPDGDEPPYPIAGPKMMVKAIVQAADRFQAAGKLVVVATIDGDGKARSARVLDAPDEQLAKFAAHVLMVERYKPAVCGGTPCTMDFPLRIDLQKAR